MTVSGIVNAYKKEVKVLGFEDIKETLILITSDLRVHLAMLSSHLQNRLRAQVQYLMYQQMKL